MMATQGMFIVLEGADGSGKSTQFKLLKERLVAAGYDVEVFSFPRYDKLSSHFIKKYLNGEYGPAAEVSAYTASLFYALDRYEAAADIKKAMAENKIVLSDRYVGSNMAHQGSKFSDPGEQRGFFIWADSLEYQLLGIPRPDINFFLRVPAEISQRLISKKAKRDYTDKTHDEHEKDLEHLQKTIGTYELLCSLFPRDFKAIESTKDGRILSLTKINNLIWEQLKPLLPEPSHKGHKTVVRLGPGSTATEAKPRQGGNMFSSSVKGDVVKIEKISLLAAALAIGIAGISLKNKILWSQDAKAAFYTPDALKGSLLKKYKETMSGLGRLYKKLNAELEKKYPKRQKEISSTLLSITPMAALCDIELNANNQAFELFLSRLELCELSEAKKIASQITKNYKSPLPDTRSPESISQIIKQIVETRLPQTFSGSSDNVKLLESLPRNEFDLLADTLFPYSDLPRSNIASEIDNWSYEKKAEAMEAALKEPKSQIQDRLRYRWDTVADRLILADLIAGGVYDLYSQPPTPRYGFLVPPIIEDASLEGLYNDCFDASLDLYSAFQSAALEHLAGYSTLYGHKIRWQLTLSASSIAKSYQTVPKDSHSGRVLSEMIEKINETHPLVASSLEDKSKTSRAAAKPKKTAAKKRPRK